MYMCMFPISCLLAIIRNISTKSVSASLYPQVFPQYLAQGGLPINIYWFDKALVDFSVFYFLDNLLLV